ncbi:MAG: hypothetical protein RW306_18650 [Geobacteraceae bacterium]|nr:hypothetical protein [Geobacteraceae bacterium]
MDFTSFFQYLTTIIPFLPKIYNPVIYNVSDLVLVFFWFVAAVISFYFSYGNARLWTSVSIGFFLIFWGQAYLLNPYASSYFKVTAVHTIIGAVSILLISHGFQEYFLFTKTLDITGSKRTIYLATLGAILLGSLFVYLNPKPSLFVLRNYRMAENTVWLFLSIVNIFVVLKIHHEIKGSPIANGILSFVLVFFFIVIWKGSELYLQMYQWDPAWQMLVEEFDFSIKSEGIDGAMVQIAKTMSSAGAMLSGLSVVGTFAYLFKLVR